MTFTFKLILPQALFQHTKNDLFDTGGSTANQGGKRTTLACKKWHIYNWQNKKKKLYVKLTYYDNSNKNVDHPLLRITKSWVQQK